MWWVKAKHQFRIRDASPDRQPEIQSSLVREILQIILEQTNNDCRTQIFISTSSPHKQRLLVGRFKTEVCTCSQFPTEAVLWVKEVEMVHSVDDWKSSSSTRGISMPNFEVLDAKIASAQNWILNLKERSVWRNEKPKKRAVSFVEDRSLAWSTSTSGHWSQRFCRELCRPIYYCSSKWWYLGIRFEMRRNFIVSDENPIWWHLGRIVQIKNTRVWETQDRIGIVQYGDSSEPDYHRLKTMVKRSIEQNLRIKNFDARNGNYERNAVVKTQGTKQRWQRTPGDCWQWESNGQCSKGDNCSFRHDLNKRARMTQPNPPPSSFMQQNERNASRTRSPSGKSPSGRMSRWPCKDYLKGTCTNSFCEKLHPPECLFYKFESGCRFGEKCSFAHRQVDEQPSKRSKKNGDKSAVAMLKRHEQHWRTERPVIYDHSSNTRQLGCVIQDVEPPKSSSILRKSSHMRKPIRCVKFTKAIAHHAKIRDQNPSLGMACPGEPHERNPNAPKFEDRSQEETEWQEQGAREAAWRLAKSVLKLKEKNQAAFFSPSENGCLPALNLKPEEREFVVDSCASMHMISKKDLNSAEMDTLTKSCSPTIVITANGEVQTHEEATVYVKELDILLTMTVLENTPAVLSLGKLCDEHGYSCEWINGQKPHLIENGIRIQWNTENFVPIVVPGLLASSSSSSHSSTSMTLSRQERNHPTSSSSSSTSPTTTVLSDSETREREDLCGKDSYPVSVPSEHVEEIERGDPLCSDIPEWLQEFRENLVDDRVPEHRDSHASSSHDLSLEPTSTRSKDWVSTVFILISLKTEIARSVRRPKLQGPRAEDALVEPYFVQKILVTW